MSQIIPQCAGHLSHVHNYGKNCKCEPGSETVMDVHMSEHFGY